MQSRSNGIICAGNWLVDHIKMIDRWPGEGNLCNICAQEDAGGGGACNVLFDLAALTDRIPLYAAGRIGLDAAGDWLMNEIVRRGIDPVGMKRCDALTSYTDVMTGEGTRTFFHCRGANAMFDVGDVAELQVPARIFYIGYLLLLDKLDGVDAEYGTPGARMLDVMRKRGLKTVVDLVSEAPEKFRRVVGAALPYTDVLVINEVELGNAFGVTVRRSDGELDFDIIKKAMKLAFDGGLSELAVVHYPEGAAALDCNGEFCRVASFKIDRIAGVNGAGDAFCSGVLYGLHEGISLKQTLRLGAACAACNLGSASASGGAVSLAEVSKRFDWQSN